MQQATIFDIFGIVKRGLMAEPGGGPRGGTGASRAPCSLRRTARHGARPPAPRDGQLDKGGVNMGDGIGIESAVCWLERIQCALFAELHDAICAGDADTARKWVRLLERLSFV